MASAGIDLETMLARQTAISLALQALIERLLVTRQIQPTDLVTMREFGLQLADSLRGYGNSAVQISGERVDAEVREILGQTRRARAIGSTEVAGLGKARRESLSIRQLYLRIVCRNESQVGCRDSALPGKSCR